MPCLNMQVVSMVVTERGTTCSEEIANFCMQLKYGIYALHFHCSYKITQQACQDSNHLRVDIWQYKIDSKELRIDRTE